MDYIEILEPVKGICESLQNSLSISERRLFFILDENKQLREYFPSAKVKSHISMVQNCISLENLLVQTKLRPFQSLYLAVKLASSLLQLHSTPWLLPNWDENSVYFPLHRAETYEKQAFVVINFANLYGAPQYETQNNSLNPYLVALGIILLELSEGKSFAQWIRERKDISIETNDIQDKASVAWKWVKEDARLRYGGLIYRKVIERCLECSFSSTQVLNLGSLDNAPFREAIYVDVVHPLETIFNAFTNPLQLEECHPADM